MYQIIKDNRPIALTERPVWVRLQENGAWGLATEQTAQGIYCEGVHYHVYGKPEIPLEGIESVAVVEVDGGKMLTAGVAALLTLADAEMIDATLPGVSDALTAARGQLTALPVDGEEWDAAKRYIAGDTVTAGGVEYVALRYSKGKNPLSADGGYWEVVPAEPVYQAWSDITDGTVITEDTIVTHDGATWRCISQHIKSTVYRPKTGSSKWEAM